ncbi:MAG: hypothetical protein ACP5IC_02620 [Minisyncoccia bacterium]
MLKQKILILAILLTLNFIVVYAATNIDSVNHWAWNDSIGWIDFYSTNNVNLSGSYLHGYASSSDGFISLDCSTSPNGNICGTSNYGICNGPGPHNSDGSCPNADASGNLTGYAWNDAIGWISFNCDQSSQGGSNNCVQSNYKVTVDNSTGVFSGYAWNDIVGWISVNGYIDNTTSTYFVDSSWSTVPISGYLISEPFDMQTQGALNGITWQGLQPNGTCVRFQLAVSDSPTGPWVFYGPGQQQTTYFGDCPGLGPGYTIPIQQSDRLWISNYRYVVYKVYLFSNLDQTSSPRVDNIILNWSP